MAELTAPMQFLADAQTIPEISNRVLLAVERRGTVTADEVVRIAQTFGYSFTSEEFQQDVRRSLAERFAAGEMNVINAKEGAQPAESSCANGCLSYTINWHPFISGSSDASVAAMEGVDRHQAVEAQARGCQ